MTFPVTLPAVLGGGSPDLAGPAYEAECWAFIGEAEGVEVRWATAPVEGYEARLVEPPAAFAIGPSSSASGTPELSSTSITVSNTDAALSRLFLGMPEGSSDPADEYLGPSLLHLRGAIHRVMVAPDGTVTTQQVSPLLAASGPVEAGIGTLAIPMAADADSALGRARSLRTLREWIEFTSFTVTSKGPGIDELYQGVVAPGAPWRAIRELLSDLSDVIVPWIYGGAPFRLIEVAKGGVRHFIGGVLDAPAEYGILHLVSIEDGRPRVINTTAGTNEFRVQIDGRTLICWSFRESDLESLGVRGEIWCVPQRQLRSPAVILRRILDDQCPGGSAAYDSTDLVAVEPGMAALRGALAGALESETTIAELLDYVCPAIGLRAWIDTEGKIRFTLRDPPDSEWRGLLPYRALSPWDVLPATADGMSSWVEVLPTEPDDVGAAASDVVIEWPSWATTVYPTQTSPSLSRWAASELPTSEERRISGTWVHPDRRDAIVMRLAGASAWPVRTIHIAVRPDILDVPIGIDTPIGQYFRLTSDWGIVAAGFGTEDRLARLVRMEVRPGDHCVVLTLEDMGAMDALIIGKLDELEEWIDYDPSGVGGPGISISRVTVGGVPYGLITGLGSYPVTPMPDQTIWGPPSSAEGREGECSYRIIDPSHALGGVLVDPPYELPGGGSVSWGEDWLLMRTYATGQDVAREGYIAAASDETGLLDGRPPFRFAGL